METDDAGLRLCGYIRETLGNHDVQIVLRTGQPGQAPEREVILSYEINGYFLKTELTAAKLHSIIICALRPGLTSRASSAAVESPAHDSLARSGRRRPWG